jgi:cyclic pyranopterin phosphate synthase
MRGTNDDEMTDLLDYGRRVGAEVRFIEYMDVGGATRWQPERVVPRAEMLERLALHYGPIEPLHEESTAPADRYVLPDGATFGIISSTTQPFCGSCDRSRLTADGQWLLCLYARSGLDLRAPLRAGASNEEIAALLARAWSARTDRGAEARLALAARTPLAEREELQRHPHLEMHTRGG